MKRFIAALLFVFTLVLPAVSGGAETSGENPGENPGEGILFSLSSSAVFYTQPCPVELSVVVNPGISAGALNITYDYTKVFLERTAVHEGFPADVVSVTDNKYGQVRFTFLSREGVMRGTGPALILYFAAVSPGACFSEIAVAQNPGSVYDGNYLPASYACPAGRVTFFGDDFRTVPESSYSIHHESRLITGVAPKTAVSAFRANFEGEFEVFSDGSFIGTGTRVKAGFFDYYAAVRGDVDGDGRIGVMDYIVLRLSILGLHPLSGAFFAAADTDQSGRINVTDYILVRLNILGLGPLP